MANLNILIVDDSPTIRAMLVKTLHYRWHPSRGNAYTQATDKKHSKK